MEVSKTNKKTDFTNLAPTWMQDNLEFLGGKKLKEICIPGSHDSGMYKITIGGTVGTYECNTLTQTNPIYGQLCYGIRYFDFRPVIASDQYYTGHYSNVIKNAWVGTNGESFKEIISDINDFTKSNQELIIFNLSHAYNTDNKYTEFTQDEWNGLMEILSKEVNNLFCFSGEDTNLITNQTLNTFIGNGKSAVVFIIDAPAKLPPHGNPFVFGKYKNQGFYPYESCNAINKYTGTSNLGDMMTDQLNKMNRYSRDYFLLSWTLTQNGVQAATCHTVEGKLGGVPSIKDLANDANNKLSTIERSVTAYNKPNIIYTDNIVDNSAAKLAMKLNHLSIYVKKFLANGTWPYLYKTMVPFTSGGKTYIFAQTDVEDNKKYHWFIIELTPENLSSYNVLAEGKWNNYYGTVIPFYSDGNTYLFAQTDTADSNNRWFISQLTQDDSVNSAKIISSELANGHWYNYYGTAVPFIIKNKVKGDKTYLFAHSETGDNRWFISELTPDGSGFKTELANGHLDNYYGTAVPFTSEDKAYLFAQTDKMITTGLFLS